MRARFFVLLSKRHTHVCFTYILYSSRHAQSKRRLSLSLFLLERHLITQNETSRNHHRNHVVFISSECSRGDRYCLTLCEYHRVPSSVSQLSTPRRVVVAKKRDEEDEETRRISQSVVDRRRRRQRRRFFRERIRGGASETSQPRLRHGLDFHLESEPIGPGFLGETNHRTTKEKR